MAASRILLVDDDQDICLLLSRFLEKKGYVVRTAGRKSAALPILKDEKFDLILCDHRLPDADSLEMLDHFKSMATGVPVLIITGYSDVRVAVELMRKGARDYVVKPLYPDDIALRIEEALSKDSPSAVAPSANGNGSRRNAAPAGTAPTNFVHGSGTFASQLTKHIKLVAPTDLSLLLIGETGTGKEFVAKEIHRQGVRSDKPFVALDCGALPAELAGSELFGHVKGSFTGALNDKAGCFQQADGGTLFLDEIGNLSYENQVKLLRVLQERKVRRIGDNKDIAVDVRIIAATNEDLTIATREGRFREDLFHRLNEFTIQLLPLRDRKEDIQMYAEHFLRLASERLSRNVTAMSPEVVEKLRQHAWYGNLRELNNVIKRAVLLCNSDTIHLEQLPMEIIAGNATRPMERSSMAGGGSDTRPVAADDDLRAVAQHAEKQAILTALERNGFNKSRTAEMLNIDRKTLYNKLKSFGIDL
jgi:two-component system, NtrC family, response regulator HydG